MKMMSSQKKNEEMEDSSYVVYNVDGILKFLGQKVTIALSDNQLDIAICVCKDAYDLPYFASKNKGFPSTLNSYNFVIASAVVLDPENLPYEIENDEEIFIIYDGWDFTRYNTMEAAVLNIEYVLARYINSEIDDFTILVCKEFGKIAFDSFVNRIGYCRTALNED